MMNFDDFKNNLDIFGPDFSNWPEDIRYEAKRSADLSPELQRLVKEEKLMEEALNLRAFKDPSDDLESRIIKASTESSLKNGAHAKSIFDIVSGIFNSFHLPNPAFALSMILLLGITLGYIGNTNEDESLSSSDNITTGINFYDGDFYE